MFEGVDSYPGDPILTLMENYLSDTRAHKANLSIGLYYDENGRIPILECVRSALAALAQSHTARTYLPMEGALDFRRSLQKLVLGDHPAVREERVATIHSLGGSGALKVGADFLRYYFPDSQVWLSAPTWDNHRAIFEGAGMRVNEYPYYDPQSNGLLFERMLATIDALPSRAIVLFHPCCHNPTGVDLTREQWGQVIDVVKRRDLIPFMDMAYQGFGDGIEEDAWPVRAMADAGVALLVGNSFSKNMALYGERVGGLSIICENTKTRDAVLGQLKAAVRRNYSSPPMFGSEVAGHVLRSPQLHALWVSEVGAMRVRIKEMRQGLFDALSARLPGMDFSYIVNQRGMFTYTGLTADEVDEMRETYGVYAVRSGRICVAGLNHSNIERTAEAMSAVLEKRSA